MALPIPRPTGGKLLCEFAAGSDTFKIEADESSPDALAGLPVIEITKTGPAPNHRIEEVVEGTGALVKIKPQKKREGQEIAPQRNRAERHIDDLAAFQVPAVLFSGGEPLSRPDVFELAAYARSLGLHVVLSTNGTLIDRKAAERLKELQFAYVGICLDSAFPEVHDQFRGVKGAYERTMRGFRHCVAVGQKVGLRLTLTRETCENLDEIFDLIEREGINRACFYHLCPSGRGKDL